MTDPIPLRTFTALELAHDALELVGKYTPAQQAAEPVDVDRALHFMELLIAELCETHRIQWLIPTTLDIPLIADQQDYALNTSSGNYTAPSDKIVYPISAWLRDQNDHDQRIDIVRREQWEALEMKDTSGTPDEVYIDRVNDDKTMSVYPIPIAIDGSTLAYDAQTGNFTVGATLTGGTSGATAIIQADSDSGATGTLTLESVSGTFQDNEAITDDSGGAAVANGLVMLPMSVRLVFMTYAPSMLGATTPQTDGDTAHGFPRGWQRWIAHATAADIGNGPVVRLPLERLKDIRAVADLAKKELLGYQNRERGTMRLRRTRRWSA